MLSTVNSVGHGGITMPPFALKDLSAVAARASLRPFDTGFSRRGGSRDKLRVANFLTFTGSPGIWGPVSTNSVMLAVSEINKRGGILGREIELSMCDAGAPME